MKIVEQKLTSTDLIKCEKLRPIEKNHSKNLRQVMLPTGCNAVYLKPNTVHKTNGIEVYYQCGAMTARENSLVELFCQIIGEASFNVLRTQEQLGYIVASGVRSFGGVQGIRIIVQSDKSPAYLNERIENFINITKVSIYFLKLFYNFFYFNQIKDFKNINNSEIYLNLIQSMNY